MSDRPNIKTAPPTDENLWLAFCYLTGELSADECARFESRLDQEPALCDALAEAVQLVDALARPKPVSPDSAASQVRSARNASLLWISATRHNRSSRSADIRSYGAVLAVLLCLVLLLSWTASHIAPEHNDRNSSQRMADSSSRNTASESEEDAIASLPNGETSQNHSDVLAVWIALGDHQDLESGLTEDLDPELLANMDDADSQAESDQVPEWIFTALSASVERSTEIPETMPPREEPL